MIVTQLEVGSMRNFSYVLGDRAGGVGAIIDPAGELPRLLQALAAAELTLAYVINTHAHFDHVVGNAELRARGAKVVAHATAKPAPDVSVQDGATLRLGELELSFVHTPGHSPDSLCVRVLDNLFTGDTLFIGECGRVDLPGSDPRAMHHSLVTVLCGLPDELVVWPGHNYGEAPSRTLGLEKRLNYTLTPRTLDEFLAFMRAP